MREKIVFEMKLGIMGSGFTDQCYHLLIDGKRVGFVYDHPFAAAFFCVAPKLYEVLRHAYQELSAGAVSEETREDIEAVIWEADSALYGMRFDEHGIRIRELPEVPATKVEGAANVAKED